MTNSAIHPVPFDFRLLPTPDRSWEKYHAPLIPGACFNFTFFIEFSSILTIFVSYIVRNHGTSEPEETVGCISPMKKHGFKSDM